MHVDASRHDLSDHLLVGSPLFVLFVVRAMFFFYLAYFIGYLRRSDLGGERGRGLRALPDQTTFRFQFPIGQSTIEIGHRATK